MLTVQQIKDTVTTYFKDKPVKEVYLFGSYARGEAGENSDVDLGVVIERDNMSMWQYVALALGLEDVLKKKVDLVQIDLMHNWVKKNFEKEKISIYKA